MCVVAVFNIHRSFVLACKTSVVLHKEGKRWTSSGGKETWTRGLQVD